jgi:hypothetical protein
MTRIKFRVNKNKENQYIEIDNESKDYKYYQIQKILVFDKDWEKAKGEYPEKFESHKFKLKSDKMLPLWLRICLEKKDSEIKGYAKKRYYYLYLHCQDKAISVVTNAKPKMKSGYIKTNAEKSAWCDSIWRENDSTLLDKYNDILRFYLIYYPSKEERTLSKQFTDIYSLWGDNCFSNNKEQLKAKLSMYKVKGIMDKTGGIANSADDMKHRIENFDLLMLRKNELASISKENRIVLVDTEENQYLSLFRHLRNSIAHGTFLIYKHDFVDCFIFQDSLRKNVTARGIVDMSTLEKWRDIILSKA